MVDDAAARGRIEDKRARVRDRHVAPLNALVDDWRGVHPAVPWFDPDDGGVLARVLILMESPAPRTMRVGGTGFCSEDNPDSSNRLLSSLRDEHGPARADCLKWNIVPWAVLDDAGRARTPDAGELAEAGAMLQEVLSVATAVEVVLTLGRPALAGYMAYLTAAPGRPLLPVVSAPHPSQRNTRGRDDAIRRIGVAFGAARDHLA
ncbi:uracil-DNA glycosylase [Williamsia serinedens]|uniref:Uracil-DNA glycosylase n=1 Tax=Williamsia serinedens TaxID=391736 RepID=A0ABT1H4T4_9NOCA|nr:uracil-DNA glycosylase [Williamsia serinedens]MCP2162245.1 Uracil-DNA glycosylase [Williamsia serinedens]